MKFFEDFGGVGGGVFAQNFGVVFAVEVVEDFVRRLVNQMNRAAVNVQQNKIVALFEFVYAVKNFKSPPSIFVVCQP